MIWNGQLKAPVTGTYTFTTLRDDGARLWINDSLLIDKWSDHAPIEDNVTINLVAGQMYKFNLMFKEDKGYATMKLSWAYPGQTKQVIPAPFFYLPPEDIIPVNNSLKLERRITSFRKASHLSEIDVLNPDGRKYVYGIPVYNFLQKEATFSVNGKTDGNLSTGLVKYVNGVDNTTKNLKGQDNYFNSETIPAYAHSFLLTGILSSDYVDLTGNGISDDDLGDAVKFKYSKINGLTNPFCWRAPYAKDSVTFNDGLKTDYRDDKGSYTYGEKELWFMHSIESKTMIATFVTENREDVLAIDESGRKYNDHSAKRLKEINLYSKSDWLHDPTTAKPIKTVHFDYSYELCLGVNKPVSDSGKLTLKRIWFTYNGNAKIRQNPYVFNYNSKNPSYNLKSYDRWGNYKDPLQNPGSTTGNVITNSEYPYGLQDSSLAAQNASAWTLDSVFLPSGGSIKVNFESDDYAFVQNKRAMSMFKLAGLGASAGLPNPEQKLFKNSGDNLYVYVKVPQSVSTAQDVYQKYLTGVKTLFFRLFVQMPTDIYGKGYEYVSCYADLDASGAYGVVSGQPNTIWIKIAGISIKGDGTGNYSPLAKAAIQFLRLNLPSKAYPGSQVGDNVDLAAAVQMIFSLADNIKSAFTSFDAQSRSNGWAVSIDTSRSYVRLNSPLYNKIGGGHRVKRITIYDNWNKMTGQRTAIYGQDYTYKTVQNLNGVNTLISSGVATWEPGIGGEENPFRVPIKYIQDASVLGPVAMGYSEEPLGESLFPSPLIGYSKVRVRTINYKNIRSANGYEETKFYTAYDFPAFTDRTLINGDSKKMFKPSIANFLRINAKYYLSISQGFKVELNDMHGKLRSHAYYAETDPKTPITYTENIYRVENPFSDQKRLSNVVMAMSSDGVIDTTALIGKDVELMMDMREQQSVTTGNNISVNTDLFAIPFLPPFFLIPSFLSLAQRQENKFRSIATTKIIQRNGILDSVIHIDKGSKVTTRDLVYDAESGDVLLNATQNEFNDPVYTFNYPANWAYNAMGPAYQNIGVTASHISFSKGKIKSGLAVPEEDIFASGDELIVFGKQFTGAAGTCTSYASFAGSTKIWAFDSAIAGVGPSKLYFIDNLGNPYTGADVNVKVIRSGRKNLGGSVGSVTMLGNPLRKNGANQYQIYIDSLSKVVTASSAEFKNVWNVESRNAQRTLKQINCPATPYCYDTIPANYQPAPLVTCFSPATYYLYSVYGAYVYSAASTTATSEHIVDSSGFWESFGSAAEGRLNQCGIWACGGCSGGNCFPNGVWIGFNKTIYVPNSDTVFIGMAADNFIQVTIDQKDTVKGIDPSGGNPYYKWHIFPKYLARGYHNFKVEGYNISAQATFGAEIYNISRSQLMTADSNTIKSHTIFSTSEEANLRDSFPTGYSCPISYRLDSTGGTKRCIKPVPCRCDTVYSSSCYNAITDTTINPFTTNIIGNWRNYRAYTYYGSRLESDPAQAISTRVSGTIQNFAPFWKFQGGKLLPAYDTSRWVWNTQSTIFNKKGFEIENKDPLGRYNTGLYGYGFSLPVAAVQNAQYREAAYDGFEDYGYTTLGCDTACSSGRHFDFSNYSANITSAEKHSGNYSLQLNPGEQVSLNAKMGTVAEDTISGKLSLTTAADVCNSSQYVVSGIRANKNLVHPLFSPFANKQMLISAWVKEGQDCNCKTYLNNKIILAMAGGTALSLNLFASGPIIEGWQRYEAAFTIPVGDTSLTVSLQATGAVPVYFDDIRVQPFNANMKSFVYNSGNLRLMADLDENNYATFYEYDDDGTVIRVKKETERGIQTIKETRSALIKQ